jgi:hypothetical protein
MPKKIELPNQVSALTVIEHIQNHLTHEVFNVPIFWDNYVAGEIFKAVHKERQNYDTYLESLKKELEKYLG